LDNVTTTIGQDGENQKSELTKILTEYGQNVGMAFQLQDDILGMFGDTKETGKPVGNDLREGKKTVLLQRAYRAANEEDQKFLEKVCGKKFSENDLKRAQKIMVKTGALAIAQKMADEAAQKGLAALNQLSQEQQESVEGQVLKELAQFVVRRKN